MFSDLVDRDCYLGFLEDDGDVWETEVTVRFLQYEVREGGEAGERCLRPVAFIADRNQSFILQGGDHGGRTAGASERMEG